MPQVFSTSSRDKAFPGRAFLGAWRETVNEGAQTERSRVNVRFYNAALCVVRVFCTEYALSNPKHAALTLETRRGLDQSAPAF